MKIVMPIADLHIGGGCKVLVDTASALTKRGHEVEIVIPRTATVKYPIPCTLTVVPQLTPETIPFGDVVLTNFYTTFLPAYQAWPEQCVRFSLGFEPYWVPDRKLAEWTYTQGVPVISISHWLDRQILQISGQHSRVIPLGTDPAIFKPRFTKQGLSHDPRPPVILHIARAKEDGYALKGFDDLKAALDIVSKEWRQPFTVHLVCPDRALDLPGIDHRHFFPKDEGEMADMYRSADLFVSSSWFEAFSLPPLEAMACGTPVVTTDSGGVLDYCQHMSNAYVVPPKDPRRLAQGIAAVLSDRFLASRLSAGGKHTASQFTKLRFEESIVAAVEEAAASLQGSSVRKGGNSG